MTFDAADPAYHKTTVVGPDGDAASSGLVVLSEERDHQRGPLRRTTAATARTRSSCRPSPTRRAPPARRSSASCSRSTRAPRSRRRPASAHAREELLLDDHPPGSGVALNPGGHRVRGQIRPRRGASAPTARISGPSTDAFVDRNTGLADARFTEPGRLRDGRPHQERRLLHAVERPDPLRRQGAVRRLVHVVRATRRGRATRFAARCAIRSLAAARVGLPRQGHARRAGSASSAAPEDQLEGPLQRCASRVRRPGVYRLQYRFKGSSLVVGGKVTEAIRIRRGRQLRLTHQRGQTPWCARVWRAVAGQETRDRAPDARARRRPWSPGARAIGRAGALCAGSGGGGRAGGHRPPRPGACDRSASRRARGRRAPRDGRRRRGRRR